MSATQEHSDNAPAPAAVRVPMNHAITWTQAEAEALFALPFNDLIFPGNGLTPMRCKKARCCPSRPAGALKIAVIAARVRSLKPASRRPS